MKTKILATVGPSSLKKEILKQCAQAGVNVFRINLSHTPIDLVATCVAKIQKWTKVPVCLDSEGAQLRNQTMVKNKVKFVKGSQVKIHFSPIVGDATNISFTPPQIVKKFKIGDTIKIDFNGVTLQIIARYDDCFSANVLKGGYVGSNKAADIDREINLPAITKKDRMAIKIGYEMGVRNFALSFANSATDVVRMRAICGKDSTIFSKIESLKGLQNLSEILKNTDAILIDRGDLSRQIPLEKIPFLQRQIIATAKESATPVYVATNLLESMVTALTPTRAELNDVVSTLLMGADGLVLAAETAIGGYPVESVQMIRRLAETTEKWKPDSNINDILMF